ncbi:MAG: HAD hydrolase-like protein [Candidatus Nanopelagicales bacterium]
MPAASPSSLILFDLDGTLTDSAVGIANCIRYALDSLGIAHPDDATMRSHLGPPLVDTFRGGYGLSDIDVERAIAKYRERYHSVGLYENAVYDGIPEVLDALAASSAALAVATSKPTYSATRILEHFGLADRFAFIGGAELDGSRQRKADVIGHVLEAMAWSAAAGPIVMVGDRGHDVRGAAAHGIPAIGALWGYGDEAELVGAGAVAVVDRPAGLSADVARLLARPARPLGPLSPSWWERMPGVGPANSVRGGSSPPSDTHNRHHFRPSTRLAESDFLQEHVEPRCSGDLDLQVIREQRDLVQHLVDQDAPLRTRSGLPEPLGVHLGQNSGDVLEPLCDLLGAAPLGFGLCRFDLEQLQFGLEPPVLLGELVRVDAVGVVQVQ